MIFGGAWLSAALLTWFVFSKTTNAKTEKMGRVLAAARDLPAGTRLKQSDLKMISAAEKELPRGAMADPTMAVDRVLLFPVGSNEPVVSTKLTSSSALEGIASMIEPGKRAISVPINDTSSAGGLIQPRSKVDVLFTRSGSMREAITTTILQDVVVLSIGKATEISSDPAKAVQQSGSPTQTRAATLMVTPEQAAKLELAKNQGKISLALRNPLDKSEAEDTSATAESIEPRLFAGAARAIRGSMRPNTPNVRDDKVWADLTNGVPGETSRGPSAAKVEPPKPRHVIDVYRADRHVQEIFQ